jgi:hypothetical protein
VGQFKTDPLPENACSIGAVGNSVKSSAARNYPETGFEEINGDLPEADKRGDFESSACRALCLLCRP